MVNKLNLNIPVQYFMASYTIVHPIGCWCIICPMKSSILKNIFDVALPLGAAALYGVLLEKNVGVYWGLAMTVAVVILVLFLRSIAEQYGVRSQWVRKKLKRYSIEGYWIEYIYGRDEAPISYVVISYESGVFRYYGDNYDLNADIVAEFESDTVEVNEKGDKLSFRFTGTHVTEGKTVYGKGEVTFFTDNHKEYCRGRGYFTDDDGGVLQFNMHKVDSETIQKVYKQDEVDPQAIYDLIQHYLDLEWFRKKYRINKKPKVIANLNETTFIENELP